MRSSEAEPGGRLREIRAPFVVAAPEGARVRTRLRVSEQDAVVLEALGSYLGQLAGRDLAARCAQGRLDARGRAVSRQVRKRALTGASSSRWAGTITRVSEDSWRLAERNLREEAGSLRARVRRVEARLKRPAGDRAVGRGGTRTRRSGIRSSGGCRCCGRGSRSWRSGSRRDG